MGKHRALAEGTRVFRVLLCFFRSFFVFIRVFVGGRGDFGDGRNKGPEASAVGGARLVNSCGHFCGRERGRFGKGVSLTRPWEAFIQLKAPPTCYFCQVKRGPKKVSARQKRRWPRGRLVSGKNSRGGPIQAPYCWGADGPKKNKRPLGDGRDRGVVFVFAKRFFFSTGKVRRAHRHLQKGARKKKNGTRCLCGSGAGPCGNRGNKVLNKRVEKKTPRARPGGALPC